MPKKNPLSRQPSFFKPSIPQMPEGYYSSGPNPNLRSFVEEHAKPYDPATDRYKVKPFDQPITTTKATAIYNMHTYWSKKPHDAIRQYIRHYTQPGDLVLDPFCGSGGTALAALMEGRAAIAIDLSPAATFITKNYCTPVDVDELQHAFEELKAKVKPELDWLYETRCDRCDGRATTAYTVYSYVFQCPRCLEKVPLFDCVEVQSQTAAGKPKKIRVCPSCQERGIVEEISTRSQRFDPVPVLVSYLCEEGCKPQRGERSHNDSDLKKRAYFEKYDLAKLAEIELKSIPFWVPLNRMMNTPTDQERWGILYRAGVASFQKISDIYTRRNLIALSILLNYVPKDSPLRFAFHGILLNASRIYRHREIGGGGPAGNISLATIHREMNTFNLFDNKLNDLIRGYPELDNVIEVNSIIISTQSATEMKISPNSIDYIFTDPPYSDKFPYGELNFIWEGWMKFDTDWHNNEIIVNPIQGKMEEDWVDLMHDAMAKCFGALKPGRWLSLCYHDTSEGTWHLVQDIMTEVGFIPEHSDQTLFIDTGQKAFKQLIATKVTKRDLVINFRKPRPGELSGQLDLFDSADLASFQQAARAILTEALIAHPGQSADRLYDELVSRMVRKGQFERHDFDALLRSVAEPVSEPVMKNLFEQQPADLFGSHKSVRWYLKSSVDVIDAAESAKEEAAAARLEAFMVNFLKENRTESGVHYSDLFEQYLPIKDKPRRLLIEWLPEFFYKTSEGTWRPPADDEERQQKATLRASGALRRVKRFAHALLEGVPPYEKDRPENVSTLADWICQCRRAGLYELGKVMYEKGGLRFYGLDEVAQVELEEDYQVCVRRSEKHKKNNSSSS